MANGPTGIAFDDSGNLWVVDFYANRVLEFRPPFSTGMPASLVIGQKDFMAGFARTSRDGLNWLTRPAFDSSGNLWVLDGRNNRVLEFRPPFTNAMNASLVIGQSSFEDNAARATLNGLSCYLGDISIDPSGNVWVGDAQNNRVLEFKPPFKNGMNASLVITQENLVIDTQGDPLPSLGISNLGWAIGFDSAGNLWVSSNGRFLAFKPPFKTGVRAFPAIEIGQPNFTSFAWTGGQNGLSFGLGGTGFDPSGNLWVADTALSSATNTPSTSQPAQPFGQLQLIAVGAAILGVGGALAVVRIRSSRHKNSATDSRAEENEDGSGAHFAAFSRTNVLNEGAF